MLVQRAHSLLLQLIFVIIGLPEVLRILIYDRWRKVTIVARVVERPPCHLESSLAADRIAVVTALEIGECLPEPLVSRLWIVAGSEVAYNALVADGILNVCRKARIIQTFDASVALTAHDDSLAERVHLSELFRLF